MPNIYDIDYDQAAVDLLSPDKRSEENIAILSAQLKAIQWSRDNILGTIKQGSTAPAYSAGPYPIYYQVTYNKAVYESKIAANMDLPTVEASWRLIAPNFIGLDERIKYNGQKITLEWALNKEFGGVFRQPVTAMNSDIYIVNVGAELAGFRIGQTEAGTDVSSIGQTTSSDSIGGTYPWVNVTNFTIMFLASLYSATNEQAVRNFVNKYIPTSLKYTITVY